MDNKKMEFSNEPPDRKGLCRHRCKLEPAADPDLSWMGRFKRKARGTKHGMESIRRSIRKARKLNDV
jgi:hypothetical protein